MQLLVIRHGRAEDREAFATAGRPDAQRPLTPKGIRRMKKAARGLRLLTPHIDLLASSRLTRAAETAQIVADAYGGMERKERGELAPGASAEQLINWLADQANENTVCIVGHEPDLSGLLDMLLAAESKRPRKLKKGSATLVQFGAEVARSAGTVKWHRTARELASADFAAE
jgi:phosphohistidine phosphatase